MRSKKYPEPGEIRIGEETYKNLKDKTNFLKDKEAIITDKKAQSQKVSMVNTKKEMLDAYSTLLKQPRGKSESQNYIISISSLKNLSG